MFHPGSLLSFSHGGVQLLPVHTLRLGVELDSFDGHHYISSVAPGGPVDKHGALRPEDELLEVNTDTELMMMMISDQIRPVLILLMQTL